MRSLQGKVVVITGAGSGIGRALAVESAKKGAILALADWNEEGLKETQTEARAKESMLFSNAYSSRLISSLWIS